MTFVAFMPGLLGEKSDFSLSKNQTLQLVRDIAGEEGIKSHLITYQSEDNKSPLFSEMGKNAAQQILALQEKTGERGVIVASSMGGGVLIQACAHLAEAGGEMPHIVMIAPIIDPVAKILDLYRQKIDPLILGEAETFGVDVHKGEGQDDPGKFIIGYNHLTDENVFRLQSPHYAPPMVDLVLPPRVTDDWRSAFRGKKIPSLKILAGREGLLCDEHEARSFISDVWPLAERVEDLTTWKGEHNVSDGSRTADMRMAIKRAITNAQIPPLARANPKYHTAPRRHP